MLAEHEHEDRVAELATIFSDVLQQPVVFGLQVDDVIGCELSLYGGDGCLILQR